VGLRRQHKAYYEALLYKKYPELYRRRIRPCRPWNYYAMLLALAVAGGAGVLGWWRVALAAAGTWLAMVTWFCVGRLRGTTLAPAHVAEMVVTSAIIPAQSVFWRLRGAAAFRVWFF
jgi:hypothetical protein